MPRPARSVAALSIASLASVTSVTSVASVASSVTVALMAAACGTFSPPALRSPLKERLATADTPTVEDAIRACLDDNGWKADSIDSVSGGSNVISARNKAHETTQVFVHPPDQKPRLTGGPDDEKFWTCLGGKLGGGSADDSAGGDGGAGDKDKGDKKDDKDKGDKKDDKDNGEGAGGDKP